RARSEQRQVFVRERQQRVLATIPAAGAAKFQELGDGHVGPPITNERSTRQSAPAPWPKTEARGARRASEQGLDRQLTGNGAPGQPGADTAPTLEPSSQNRRLARGTPPTWACRGPRARPG